MIPMPDRGERKAGTVSDKIMLKKSAARSHPCEAEYRCRSGVNG
jgi:hypothetical protein